MKEKFKNFSSTVVSENPSPLRRAFDTFCASVIILDLVLIPMETMKVFHPYKPLFDKVALLVTLWFTMEYAVRLTGHKDKKAFAMSFNGLIDLVAILPFYLTLGFADASFVRIFRLFRVFRILKLTRHMKAMRDLKNAFLKVKEELLIVTIFSSFMVYIFSYLIYSFEHQAQPEKVVDMLDALWLAFVTVTTLGYGDITPITPVGRALTAMFMFFSIGLITAPSGILTTAFLANRKEEVEAEEIKEKKAA